MFVCFLHLRCSKVTKKCHEIYYQSLVPQNVCFDQKRKKEKRGDIFIHKWVRWGDVIRIRLEFKSRAWHVCVWPNLPIRRRPSVHVFSQCPTMHPSPFHWRLQERKLASCQHTGELICGHARAAAVLNLKRLPAFPPLFHLGFLNHWH